MLQQAWLQYYLSFVLFVLACCECFSEHVYWQECVHVEGKYLFN